MQVILNFDINNAHAMALLNYVRTLDFISVVEKAESLSPEEKNAIMEGLHDVEAQKTISHADEMQQTAQRYPHLFAK